MLIFNCLVKGLNQVGQEGGGWKLGWDPPELPDQQSMSPCQKGVGRTLNTVAWGGGGRALLLPYCLTSLMMTLRASSMPSDSVVPCFSSSPQPPAPSRALHHS